MGFRNSEELIAAYIATAVDGRRIVIDGTGPFGNRILFYSGQPSESDPGYLLVDADAAPSSFVQLSAPALSSDVPTFTLGAAPAPGTDGYADLQSPGLIDIAANGGPLSLTGNSVTIDGATVDLTSAVNIGGVDVTPSAWTPYTPTVTGGGTVTWSTRTGYHKLLGDGVRLMVAYLVPNAAGSGATAITITAPTGIDRTTRQCLQVHYETAAGSLLAGDAVTFTGGAGNVIDRLRVQDAGAADKLVNLTGANLTSGSILLVKGWYREI